MTIGRGRAHLPRGDAVARRDDRHADRERRPRRRRALRGRIRRDAGHERDRHGRGRRVERPLRTPRCRCTPSVALFVDRTRDRGSGDRRCRCSSSGGSSRASAPADRPSRCTSSSRGCTRPQTARSRVRGVLGGVGGALAHRTVPGGRGHRVPALAVGVPRRRRAHGGRLRDGRAAPARTPAAHRRSRPAAAWSDAWPARSPLAVGALALSLAGEAGAWSGLVVAASVVVIALAARPLLPRRTLRAARGPAQRDPHARHDRRCAVRCRDLRAVPADRRLRLLADLGGAGADRGGAPVGVGGRTCRAGSATASATCASP